MALNVRVLYREETLRALAQGPAVVTCNHVSFVDGLVVALASPVPMVFTSEVQFSVRTWWSRAGMHLLSRLGLGWVIPLDAENPLGLRRALRELKAGRCVFMFPEGAISPDGRPMQESHGASWLAQKAGRCIIRLRIDGAHRSRLFGKRGDLWYPPIRLTF